MEGSPVEARLPPAWLIGMEALPFGLVLGFAVTALRFLLSSTGIPTDQVALGSAIVLSANSWGSLLNPILDVGLTRRAYAWLTAALSAICMGAAFWNLEPARLRSVTLLLVAAVLAIVLNSGAVQGWTAEFVPERLRGAVGGWFNAAYLGAGALGSLVLMQSARRFSMHSLGAGVAVAILLSALSRRSGFPSPGTPHFVSAKSFLTPHEPYGQSQNAGRAWSDSRCSSVPQAASLPSTFSPHWERLRCKR